MAKRAILIVLDGCGAGEAPDAALFHDTDHPSTIRHVWDFAGKLNCPNLVGSGFFAAGGVLEAGAPHLAGFDIGFGRLRELSQGKDSVTGHWELMGIVTKTPFPTYPNGFPENLVEEFERRIGRKVLGNRPASGTEIIGQVGEEHLRTGYPILYTSADSVFQLAAHESVVPLNQLYAWCEVARELCVLPDNVQRVIARPFAGGVGNFVRTAGRKDFALTPPPNFVDACGDVLGLGVVPELFGGRGFQTVPRTTSNEAHGAALLTALNTSARFVFSNFEDFDMLYGHRNDPAGFGQALEHFDSFLGDLLPRLGPDDLLLLTADHGNDPTTGSTNHSREFVPICVIEPGETTARALGDIDGMASVAVTVASRLGIAFASESGRSLLRNPH